MPLKTMPTFQFLLHTTGIRHQVEGSEDAPAIGFYAVRRARAKNSDETAHETMS